MFAAATIRGEHWCQCNDVSISHNEVKSHKWQQQRHWWTRGCSGSCICRKEACCRQMGNGGRQEAPADGNSEDSEDNKNMGDKQSKGDEGEGNGGNDRNMPKGGGR
jgi:hypothetical protein